MKKILASTIMCFAAMAAMAQTADIEVSYTTRSLYRNGVERINKYHLLANSTLSKFYSPRSEEIDSLISTPEGLAAFKKTQEAALKAMIGQGMIDMKNLPRKKENVYVIKSVRDSMITVYDMLDNEPVYYTEPFAELTWETGDSTKTYLDMNVSKRRPTITAAIGRSGLRRKYLFMMDLGSSEVCPDLSLKPPRETE